MKTAISLPDDVYRKADETAKRLGMTRSRLYAMAVAEFVARCEADEVTARLDGIYGNDPEGPDPILLAMAMDAIEPEGW